MPGRLTHDGICCANDASEDCVDMCSMFQPAEIKAGPEKPCHTGCRGLDETPPGETPDTSNCTSVNLGGSGENFAIVECNGQSNPAEQLVRQNLEGHGQDLFSAKHQAFWMTWVEKTFPDLETRSHIWPELKVKDNPNNHQTSTRPGEEQSKRRSSTPTAHAQEVNPKPPTVQDSSVALPAAMRQVVFSLWKFYQVTQERVTVLTPHEFGNHRQEACYAAIAAQALRPPGVPEGPTRRYREGEFDVLVIHRQFGLIVCEVTALGNIVQQTDASQHEDAAKVVREALKDAIMRLEEAEAWLSHLVSDVAPHLRITKTMAFPNLTNDKLNGAVVEDVQLQEEMRRCLKAARDADVSSLCICSDKLCDSGMRGEETSRALRRLKEWWSELVIRHGRDDSMTPDLYKVLVARFCGAASTVSFPCYSLPRLCLETLEGATPNSDAQGLSAHVALSVEQAQLLNAAPPKVFLTGPPGTGKTSVLLLMAREWLRRQRTVCVLSTWDRSYVACAALHGLLQRVSEAEGHSERLRFLEYNFRLKSDLEKAVEELRALAKDGELCIVADEAGPDVLYAPQDDLQLYQVFSKPHFQLFCDRLQVEIPRLHLWAASCRQRTAHPDWHVQHLTRAFRQPPSVGREVARADEFEVDVDTYAEEKSQNPDVPSVTVIYHGGQGHEGERTGNCVTCGVEIAAALHRLAVRPGDSDSISTNTCSDTTDTSPTPLPSADGPTLGCRDVLVVSTGRLRHDSGVVEGLRSSGVPVRVMDSRSRQDVQGVATARDDVVWVLSGTEARGVERKVVVCLREEYPHTDVYNRLYPLSRCTSHLVLVCPPAPGDRGPFSSHHPVS